jgi:hypothetical protein
MAATTVGERPVGASADLLRRGLLWLATLGTVGITLELIMERHWESGLQLIPFAALGGLAVAIALVARPRGRRSILAGRGIGAAVLVTSAIGVFIHVRANYEAAPLDFRYTDSWPTTPEPIRWLLAATDTVGPSPSLAPAALAFLALLLLIATLRHPSAEGTPT